VSVLTLVTTGGVAVTMITATKLSGIDEELNKREQSDYH